MAKTSWKPGNMVYPLPAVMVSVRDQAGQDKCFQGAHMIAYEHAGRLQLDKIFHAFHMHTYSGVFQRVQHAQAAGYPTVSAVLMFFS